MPNIRNPYEEGSSEWASFEMVRLRQQNPQDSFILADESRDVITPSTFSRYVYGNAIDIIEPRSNLNCCGNCGERITAANEVSHYMVWGRMYCDRCYHENFDVCDWCHEANSSLREVMLSDQEHQDVCDECRSRGIDEGRITGCRNCSHYFDVTRYLLVGGYCPECVAVHRAQGAILERKYSDDKSLITETLGTVVKSKRPFGIELEASWKTQKQASKASCDLPAFVGVGRDGSIQGNGMEVQTPPASGKKAEELITNVCKTLITNKFTVNQSCGYHIHMDVSGIDKLDPITQLNRVKNIWLLYMSLEDVFLSFLPPSRRHNTRYCMPLKSEYHVDEIMRANNMDQLEQLWYRITSKELITRAKSEHRHASRYRGINLHPMFSGRHLEIRYHSGTLNARKIFEWANLHLRLVDYALNNNWHHDRAKYLASSIDIAEKTNELFDIVNLGPENKGYFLARQEMFRQKPPQVEKTDHFKSGMAVLQEEQEN